MQYNLTLWGESGRVPEILGAHGCGGEKSFHQPRPPRQDWPSPLVRFKVLCGNVLQPLLPISQEKQTPLQPPAQTVWAAARAQPRLCRQGWKAAHPLQTPAKEKPPQAKNHHPNQNPGLVKPNSTSALCRFSPLLGKRQRASPWAGQCTVLQGT